MPDETEQLDRDAQLTLYAAGEMTPEQRAQFEAKLASDAALSADVQRARDAIDRSEAALRDLDDRQRLPVNPAVAVRRIERAMQQWSVDRLRKPADESRPTLRMPWWSYPAAAAAIVIVAFLVWSGRQEIQPTPADTIARTNMLMADAEALAERLEKEFELPPELASDRPMTSPLSAADFEDSGAFFINPGEEASW